MATKVFSIYDTYIAPGADDTSDIGSSSLEWKNLYIDGTAYIDSIGESILFADNISFTFGTGTGIKIGVATNNKIGFFNATPVVQAVSTADIRTSLINYGLLASGGANPLNLNGGLLTAGSATISNLISAGTGSFSGAVIATSGSVLGTLTVGTVSASGLVIGTSGSILNTLTVGTLSGGQIRGSGYYYSVSLKTATFSVATNEDVLLVNCSGGAVTMNLVGAATNPGKMYYVKKVDSSVNAITIDPDGTEQIDGVATATIGTQYNSLTFVAATATTNGWWII